MAKAKTPRYLNWNNGKPRWAPGPSARQIGAKTTTLRHPHTNQYADFEMACAMARRLNNLLDEARIKGTMFHDTAIPAPGKDKLCLKNLAEDWFQSRQFRDLAPVTQRDYRIKLQRFLDDAGHLHPAALKYHVLGKWYDSYFDRLYANAVLDIDLDKFKALNSNKKSEIRERRYDAISEGDAPGHTMANRTIAVIGSLYKYLRKQGIVDFNPAHDQNLIEVKPEPRMIEVREISAIIKTADKIGFHSIADAFILGISIGQRGGDLIKLPNSLTNDTTATIQQSKRGALVQVPFSRAALARLQLIKQRRLNAGITKINTTLLIDERTNKPFTRNSFAKLVRRVCDEAGKIETSCNTICFRHARSTCVIRMSDGGATPQQIAAVTGHSLQTVNIILKHYNRATNTQAAEAIMALERWFDTTGAEA